MDGVIADFESGFLNKWKNLHPDIPHIPLNQRTTFYPRDQYPNDLAEQIVLTQGFYKNLPPIKHALEAIKDLQKKYEVYILTSPRTDYKHCVLEKFEWVDYHLGREWIKRLIVAKEKTLVHGDVLIDDKTDITGIKKPAWKHILYKQPYNTGEFTWKIYKDFFTQKKCRK